METLYNDFCIWYKGWRSSGTWTIVFLAILVAFIVSCPGGDDDPTVAQREPAVKVVKESNEVIMLRKIDNVLERSAQVEDSLDIDAWFLGYGAVEMVSNNHKTLTNVVIGLNINYYYFLDEMIPGVKYTVSSSDFLSTPEESYNRKTMKNLWFNVVCDQGLRGSSWKGVDTKAPFRLPPRKH